MKDCIKNLTNLLQTAAKKLSHPKDMCYNVILQLINTKTAQSLLNKFKVGLKIPNEILLWYYSFPVILNIGVLIG